MYSIAEVIKVGDDIVAIDMCWSYLNLDVNQMPVCYWISL